MGVKVILNIFIILGCVALCVFYLALVKAAGKNDYEKNRRRFMKFYNLNAENLEGFFDVVKTCKGDVYLENEDLKLNLKSQMCKYIAFAKLCSADSEIPELQISVTNKEDLPVLMKFMQNIK